MRPQHITAENAALAGYARGSAPASMRPQHITAENSRRSCDHREPRRCFNEAAAYHCGKPGRPRPSPRRPRRFNEAAAYHCGKREADSRVPSAQAHASMRPQHITAENVESIPRTGRRTSGFNEAAAYHCGKPRSAHGTWTTSRRLQ